MEREIYEEMDATEDRHWWFEGRRAVLKALIERHASLSPSSRTLDVGCGTGGNLAFLSQFGALEACEYDDAARAIASRKSGINVKYADVPADMDAVGAGFDLVTLLDVLEHLEDDVASLKAIAAKLSDKGTLVLTVPAMPWLWSEHDRKHHHFRRYTAKSLRAAIEQAGLKAERIGYFNSLLFPLAIAQRGLARFSKAAANAGDVPPPLVNGTFETIFGLESKLVNRIKFPAGLSLYAVVKP